MFLRTRRLRKNEIFRDMLADINLDVTKDLIYPLFIIEGENIKEEISSMTSQYRFSIDRLSEELDECLELGINKILLFGIPEHKDEVGSEAYSDTGIIQKAIRYIREKYKNKFLIITDVCMCEYTSHGHCGIIKDNDVDNDKSLEYIAKIALSHAKAGADIVAPSDMMDGRVQAIRKILDENSLKNIAIMSYSVKYASAFYGPFREAADSAPCFGDRKTYQMDFRNSKEYFREAYADEEEGADFLIVKPAMSYLDIIKDLSYKTNLPLVAYHVSGEYAMIKAAAQNNWIDEKRIVLESMYGIKRAGADLIITYYTKEIAKWLENK